MPGSFEESLEELDAILRALEDGSTTLEDALTRYERGVALLKSCTSQLARAESRIQQLAAPDPGQESDPPKLSPFEHTAAVERATTPKRRPAPPRLPENELPF